MIASRRDLFTGAAVFATVGIIRYPADAAEFNYKFATESAPDDPKTLRLIEAVDRIKQDSNGRLDIHVFANSSLGNSTEQIAQVR
jgi:TRAP-type C4-dicarboxylate transport system substrate-binding protein